MSSVVKKKISHVVSNQSSDYQINSKPKRKRERPKTQKCSLMPAHAFSPNVNNSRITQKKGLYAFGKTSLRVSRDDYFKQTEESAARANEDLHKIIDLANCDHKSVKHAELNAKEEFIFPKQTTSLNPSRIEAFSQGNSEKSSSYLSEASTRSVTSSNSTKKTRKPPRQGESHGDQPDMISDIISPACVRASRHTSPASNIEIPSGVWEDVTKELLTTISIKLRDLRQNKDGTNGDLFCEKIRQHLQRVHRQSFKANVLSQLGPNRCFYESPTNHAVHLEDTTNYAAGDIQSQISPTGTPPSCDPVDYRVKIPLQLSRPFSVVFSDYHNTENGLFQIADFSGKCDYQNNLQRTDFFATSDGPIAKRRQLYPASPIPPLFGSPLQVPAGLDILDYADPSAARSNDVSVHENLANISPEHSLNGNATWRSLPVVSPIKLSPYLNPTPRFYRRKLY